MPNSMTGTLIEELKMNKNSEASLIAVAAAAMAISNYGHTVPIDSIRWLLKGTNRGDMQAGYVVCELAGHLMESEDHETMFVEEAERWVSTVKKKGLRNMHLTWPHHKEWLDLLVEHLA
jgi:hypothetical protein